MALPAASTIPWSPLLIAATAVSAALPALLLSGTPKDPHHRARIVALGCAVVLLAGVWLSPIEVVAQHYLLTAHLVQITVLMGAVPPLLLLSLPSSAPLRLPRTLRRTLSVAVHPLFAIIVVNAAFFGWHLSAPYAASMQNDSLYQLQQLSLLAASVLFWWPIVSPLGRPRRMSPLTTMGYIVLATIPQTFGGLAVALAHHLLYPLYGSAPRITSIDPLTDQQIAGACIALLSKIALFTAFTVLLLRVLGAGDSESDEGGGGGGGSSRRDQPRPAPSGTPKWFDDLQRGRTVPEPAIPAPVRLPAGSGARPG